MFIPLPTIRTLGFCGKGEEGRGREHPWKTMAFVTKWSTGGNDSKLQQAAQFLNRVLAESMPPIELHGTNAENKSQLNGQRRRKQATWSFD
jgi:hypothetical protein